jgi:hypothetical protein
MTLMHPTLYIKFKQPGASIKHQESVGFNRPRLSLIKRIETESEPASTRMSEGGILISERVFRAYIVLFSFGSRWPGDG